MRVSWAIGVAISLSHAVIAGGQEYADVTRLTPNAEAGRSVFAACVACHGSDGAGTRDGNVPRIAGQRFGVLVRQLVDYRHGRRWDIRMERIADRHVLKDAQAIADVAAFASTLATAEPAGLGAGVLVGHGATLYDRLCKACHDDTSRASASTPGLRGQHYEYLLRQMHDAVEERRPNFDRAHVRTLARLDRDDMTALADFLSRSAWEEAPSGLR